MEPVKFPGCNVIFGANQPDYQPLPAMRLPEDPSGMVTTCWKLTPEEIEIVKRTGVIYITQLTFNTPFQPILPMAELGDNIELTS